VPGSPEKGLKTDKDPGPGTQIRRKLTDTTLGKLKKNSGSEKFVSIYFSFSDTLLFIIYLFSKEMRQVKNCSK